MKSFFLGCFILLLSLSACKMDQEQQNSELPRSAVAQIKALKTAEEKSTFLYNLWQEDQGLRKGQENEVVLKYGNKSKEHIEHLKQAIHLDRSVFNRLKTYLEIHGYPTQPEKYHELAINAFPIIIGHNHQYEQQKEVLPYLYSAYQTGDCPLGDLVWVLGEMYESVNNGRHYQVSTSKFTTEQEFKELNEELNLGLSLNES